jgi:hypothetical protein
MILYQASLSLQVLKKYYEIFKEPLSVLLSVALIGGETKGFLVDYRYMVHKIVADSGAWSVAKGASDLTIEKVIAYFKEHGSKFDPPGYFNFDTDFSDDGFENNISHQKRMEREGLSPIPVVHNFFDEEIDYYVQSGKYPWLALGSSQTTNFDNLKYAVDRIKTWGNQNIRLHWFGGSRFDWLIRLPIASCDTSSWAKQGANRVINYWNPHNPDLNKADPIYVGGAMGESSKSINHFVTYPWRKELEEYLRETFGFEYEDLTGYDDVFHMQLVNTRFYAELESRINMERARRGVPLE